MCLVALCYRAHNYSFSSLLTLVVVDGWNTKRYNQINQIVFSYSPYAPIFIAPNVLPIIAVVDLLRFVLSISFFRADHY